VDRSQRISLDRCVGIGSIRTHRQRGWKRSRVTVEDRRGGACSTRRYSSPTDERPSPTARAYDVVAYRQAASRGVLPGPPSPAPEPGLERGCHRGMGARRGSCRGRPSTGVPSPGSVRRGDPRGARDPAGDDRVPRPAAIPDPTPIAPDPTTGQLAVREVITHTPRVEAVHRRVVCPALETASAGSRAAHPWSAATDERVVGRPL
jgi:hypothetical protein